MVCALLTWIMEWKSMTTTERMLKATNMKIKHITFYDKSSASGSASFFNTKKRYETTNKIYSLWKRKEWVFCFAKYCYRISNISVACKYNNVLMIQMWLQYSQSWTRTVHTLCTEYHTHYDMLWYLQLIIRHRRSVHYVTGHRLQQGFHLHSAPFRSIHLFWSKVVHCCTVKWVR